MSLQDRQSVEKNHFAKPPVPPDSAEWQELDRRLSVKHPARWLKKYVEQLDLSDLFESYSGRGSMPYDPRLLLAMILYERKINRTSPANWFEDCNDEGNALTWLGCGIKPSRATWYNFEIRLGSWLVGINEDVIRREQQKGNISGEIGTQDGTFIRACASRHRIVNRERLDRYLAALKVEIEWDNQSSQPARSEEEALLPGWMAKTAKGRIEQLARYTRARQKLEILLIQNSKRAKSNQQPENKIQISLSDPEATLGRDKEKVFCPLYNVQYIVDFKSRFIVGYDVFSQANDTGTLITMIERMREVLGFYPEYMLTDAGYVSILDLIDCEQRKVILIAPYQENNLTAGKKKNKPPQKLGKDRFTWNPETKTYTCPQGYQMEVHKRDKVKRRNDEYVSQTQFRCPPIHCEACPLNAQCCKNPSTGRTVKRLDGEEYLTQHQERMQTEIAKKLRKLRSSVIELSFADTKEHRGGRRLHGRGKKRAIVEVGLYVLIQNIMIQHRLDSRTVTPSKTAA